MCGLRVAYRRVDWGAGEKGTMFAMRGIEISKTFILKIGKVSGRSGGAKIYVFPKIIKFVEKAENTGQLNIMGIRFLYEKTVIYS